jgi:uncharacterized protein YcfJ
MNRLALTLLLVFPTLAWAQHGRVVQDSADYARVLSATPIPGPQVARQVCHPVTYSQADDHSLWGSVLGGVTGAVVGSRFGSGHGRDLATVTGAIGGAIAGNRIGSSGRFRQREQCETVYEPGPISGYDVTYEYQGRQGHVTLNRDPGSSLRLRKLVTVE